MEVETRKVRILTMSDTHDMHHKIKIETLPEADIFIHAGDFTKISTGQEHDRFVQFLKLLPYKHKVVIAGNHDFALDKNSYQASLKVGKHKPYNIPEVDTQGQIKKLKEVCIYLQHESVEVEGVKIFGSPYSMEFCDWGFMHSQKDAKQLWSMIPGDTDVVVTHGPPHGIQDKTIQNMHTGCKQLLAKVLAVKPKLHVFGHIHEGYGTTVQDGIIFHNASSSNFAYRLVNKSEVFEIEVKK